MTQQENTGFVAPEPDETSKEQKTGKTISRKRAFVTAGSALFAGAAMSDITQNQDIPEILLDSDSDGVADTVLTDANQDGVFDTTSPLPDDENTSGEISPPQVWNPNTAPMAGPETVNDNMSFNEAFAAAREELGPGGVFTWHGEYYNTFYAEELNESNQPTIEYATTDHHELPEIDYDAGMPDAGDVPGQDMPSAEPGSEAHAMAADFDMDGRIDAVLVDLNQDGSADILYTDINQDGQITDDEFMVIHDPEALTVPETPADGSVMTFDANADGIDDLLIADVNQDQVADIMGIDQNMDQNIEESEITILNPEAMEGVQFGPEPVEYSGEVSSDIPEDVPDEVLESMGDDLSSLEDNFDEIDEWS